MKENTGLEIYLFITPFLFIIMGIELYLIKKNNKNFNQPEYFANIASSFSMALFDILVTNYIFKTYNQIIKFSIFTVETHWTTYIWGLLLTDFVLYCAHYLGHKLPFLWGIHGVHHQAESYNLSVAFRQPWFHKVYSTSFYLFLAFVGLPLEVLKSVYTVIVISQFWTHTEFIKKEIPYLFKVLMTPAQHRVHHGKNALYIDKNFGLTFSIWDHLFGTYQAETEEVKYGITDPSNHQNIFWANVYPHVLFLKRSLIAFRRKKLFKYLTGKIYIKENIENSYSKLAEVEFLTLTEKLIFNNKYLLLQYILLVSLICFFINSNPTMNEKFIALFGGFFSFFVLGLIADRKKTALKLEALRYLLGFLWIYTELVNFSPNLTF